MKRISTVFALTAFFIALFSMALFSQEADIAGTWEGTTYVPNQGEDDLTLVIKKVEEEYQVIVSDSFGMVQGLEADDVSFEEGTLSFNFSVYTGYEEMTVWFTLEVDGDQMSGYWETADGSSEPVELKRTSS